MGRLVELGGKLTGRARTKFGKEAALIKSIFTPALEYLPLDCSNCKCQVFHIVVSPLKNEHDVAAVVQYLQCVHCEAKYKIHDGVIGGKRSSPVR